MSALNVLGRLKEVQSSGDRKWSALCPAHEDRTPSLSISEAADGKVLIYCHGGCDTETVVRAVGLEMRDLFPSAANAGSVERIVAEYDYLDETRELLYQVVRYNPKNFRQRRPDGYGGWDWSLGDTRRALYRLPEVLEAVKAGQPVFVVEGEKDVHALVALGFIATCNAGGAGKWRSEYAESLDGATVIILPDNDDAGRKHGQAVARSLNGRARVIKVVELPGLGPKEDVSNWIAAGNGRDELAALIGSTSDWRPLPASPQGAEPEAVCLEDFYAYMPQHSYLFVPSREFWPAASVNARLGSVGKAPASAWLDRNRPVEQMTWAPGEPMLIEDRLIHEAGWVPRKGVRCFNLYRPPILVHGNPRSARRWLQHVFRIYPHEAGHIISWLAHRVQRPQEKINHGLILGGAQGIGKDTVLDPVRVAVGPWNMAEVGPAQLLGRFNGFVESVILRISEARDLGGEEYSKGSRYTFYEHLKVYTAAPPEALRVDKKNLREYHARNVCGVVVTTNHPDGVYLPPDDRRFFVAWSEATKEDFSSDYWRELYGWYEREGYAHVAAYLVTLSLDTLQFDPKAPPPKTSAFWAMVDAGRAPEDADLADAVEQLGNPAALTLDDVAREATADFAEWLRDRRNSRQVPHRLRAVGYVPVRNDGAKDGLWKVRKRRQVIYARQELTERDRVTAARTRACQ